MNQISDKNSVHEMNNELEKTHHSSRRLGMITILLIFGIFGFWSVLAPLEMTISAEGKVITQSYNKTVMHPQGGIVKNIFVQEGESVKKDQPLLEIDNTEESSNLASHTRKHDTNLFLICRLKAQASLKENLDCTEYEKKVINSNNLPQLLLDANQMFTSDMSMLYTKINLLESQNHVLEFQNSGLEKQILSNQRQLLSYQEELKKWEKLLKSDAIDELRVVETRRKIEDISSKIEILRSKIEENVATIHAHQQQIKLDKETFKNTALSKSNEIQLENKLILNTINSLKNIIQNTIIKSPSDGLVTDMKIHANREVVSPQKQIMSIVPIDKKLIIEAYVLPSDIEKVYKGQNAEVSFPAFVDPSAIPIEGEIIYVSADVITPEDKKESYYIVLVEITPKGFDAIKQNDFKIIPGMPSAIFIQIGKKTLMEYLTHPVIQMFKGIYHAN